jgi:hypothetical protein
VAPAPSLGAPSPDGGGGKRTLEGPTLADLGAGGLAHHHVAPRDTARSFAQMPGWGGVYTTAKGERVNIRVSSAYQVNEAAAQQWAEFFGWLPHGAELATMQAYIAPFEEVQLICSTDAVACYQPRSQLLVFSGEDAPDGSTSEENAAHEYGHHIANNRNNHPWPALTWGTKRWASYMNVCRRVVVEKTAFPGGQGEQYRLSPAEGFAEGYRILAEKKAGITNHYWDIVDRSFFPDATALRRLEEDVLKPWTKVTSSAWSGRLARTGQQSRRVDTPLDGVMTIGLKGHRTAAVGLFTPQGKLIGAAKKKITYGVCGERRFQLRVASPAARFSVAIARP